MIRIGKLFFALFLILPAIPAGARSDGKPESAPRTMPTAATADLPREVPRVEVARVKAILLEWPDAPRDAALRTIARMGQPHYATEAMLVWVDGAFTFTVVHREEPGPLTARR